MKLKVCILEMPTLPPKSSEKPLFTGILAYQHYTKHYTKHYPRHYTFFSVVSVLEFRVFQHVACSRRGDQGECWESVGGVLRRHYPLLFPSI